MSDRHLTDLSEVVEVLDHKRVPVSADERRHRPGTVPYYGAAGKVDTIDTHLFDETLVLLGEDAVDFGNPLASKAYMVTGPSWVNNHAHVLRPLVDKIDPYYLMCALNVVDYRMYADMGTRSKLTKSSMMRIKLPVPPLAEQERIALTLRSADEYVASLRSLLSAQNVVTSEVAKDLLAGLASTAPTKSLGELASVIKGTYSSTKTPAGKYPLVLTAAEFKTADSFQLTGPSVCVPLISATGHGHASIKRLHYVEGEFALANLLAAAIPADPTVLDAKYLFYYLSTFTNDLLVPLMQGTANVSMNVASLKGVTVPVPSMADQRRFVALLDAAGTEGSAVETLLTAAVNLRQQLLQDLLIPKVEG